MKKAILWDNDGVLVHTEGWYFEAGKRVLAEYGIDAPLTEMKANLNEGKSIFDLARTKGHSQEDIDLMLRKRNELYSTLLEQHDLAIPGMHKVLQALHGKVRMGIVTTSRRVHFEIAHRTSKMLPFFELILTREDYEKSKPNPEPYRKGAQLLGCSPKECIAVEDSGRGLQAANTAGIDCVIMPNTYTQGTDFHKAQRIVKTPQELLNYLLTVLHL